MKILSIREAAEQLPISYASLLNWSKNPGSPFYSAFCRLGKKVCLDLDQLRATAFKENDRRVTGK